ncbi:aspartate/glutamate racemase family protein [Terrarubrum flagellatum]|uniref:aspartate/glutamate racemase family protein n=1 Tax=Terrirubrum flagellatum TaxID=2895980 RepID=UPI0031455A6D
MSEILVINPNSSSAVTRSMEACLARVAEGARHDIRCIDLPKSPPGIETDDHVAAVVPHVIEAVTQSTSDAFVVGCFSDPGVALARRVTKRPVIGIAEAAYLAALGLGRRFGIVSLGPSSINRHLKYLVDLKLDGRLAGDRSIDMGISALSGRDVIEIVVRVGKRLRDEDGADVVILGCAGLGRYRAAVEQELDLPVVDPVQAGAALACTTLDLGYRMRTI